MTIDHNSRKVRNSWLYVCSYLQDTVLIIEDEIPSFEAVLPAGL
jgi:hypothetical protein